MHGTSLQGFGYGDVVHQFENRYKIILAYQNCVENLLRTLSII
ncbi:MAG: hypothetical protein O4805_01365 [Trichodesmium sp. St16_bin2-tuft]|nr:hypothetical protein [Trichodesmium sp. St16_bin2-tuft]MDE5112547.1 hypothetical protein [Trichodesmium sp. St7_bin2_1]MDE5117564.1 hypothetical protein [Trichodesmium sp. St2_bin2_1]MDE5118949.1 hypothetical protein [Trichodesmium sp. St19_bin1]